MAQQRRQAQQNCGGGVSRMWVRQRRARAGQQLRPCGRGWRVTRGRGEAGGPGRRAQGLGPP